MSDERNEVTEDYPAVGEACRAELHKMAEQAADPALTAEALSLWLSEKLSKYKIPEIRLVEALPMTATGKILKRELS